MVLNASPPHSRESPAGASLPVGVRIYAVGDIHGRADLLRSLLLAIMEDTRAHPGGAPLVVFLGDYIDRGPASAHVIELLLTLSRSLPAVCLAGNHELYALRFLRDAAFGPRWFNLGGRETLASYGVSSVAGATLPGFDEMARAFGRAMPDEHRRFLMTLATSFSLGDYIFVHAGLEPGRALAEQGADVLTTIRVSPSSGPTGFGKVVVHGHTPNAEPEIAADRINIDTGAYATGRLTCLVLEGARIRFL